jgi:hypothetical protein
MYLPKIDRDALEPTAARDAMDTRELSYQITCLVDGYLAGDLNHQAINNVVGALECAKLKACRRLASPYVDQNIKGRGDMYVTRPTAATGR